MATTPAVWVLRSIQRWMGGDAIMEGEEEGLSSNCCAFGLCPKGTETVLFSARLWQTIVDSSFSSTETAIRALSSPPLTESLRVMPPKLFNAEDTLVNETVHASSVRLP